MARYLRPYLDRFPLIATRELAAAQETTRRFWPKHVSEVLGPDEYRLEMSRVLLGRLAVSYVHCTTSIRVIPSEPSPDSTLYPPLEGDVGIVADGRQLAGSRSRPLLRGPFRGSRFEAPAGRAARVGPPDARRSGRPHDGRRRSNGGGVLAPGPLRRGLSPPLR